MGFVFLFRAMELWQVIMESKEFEKDKKFYTLMHGKTVVNTMKLLDELTINLSKRLVNTVNFIIHFLHDTYTSSFTNSFRVKACNNSVKV